MVIRVTFAERTGMNGAPSEAPQELFAREMPDEIIKEKEFVQRLAPASLHNDDTLDDEEAPYEAAAESWDFTIDSKRVEEFLATVRNTEDALEYVMIDDSPTLKS